jgi:hypothetical protein
MKPAAKWPQQAMCKATATITTAADTATKMFRNLVASRLFPMPYANSKHSWVSTTQIRFNSYSSPHQYL